MIKSTIQPPDHHFIQERILRILSLHKSRDDPHVFIDHLIRAVAQTMPPKFQANLREFRPYVKTTLLGLIEGGIVCTHRGYIFLPSIEKPRLAYAARFGNIPLLVEILENGVEEYEKSRALIGAVINNEVEAVRILIKAGADVDAIDEYFGKSVMMYVTQRTSKEIVQLLRGATSERAAGKML